MSGRSHDDDDELSAAFEILAGRLFEPDSLVDVLRGVVDAAVVAVDGASAASVTLDDGDSPWTAAASDQIAGELDAAQYRAGAGPCLDALRRAVVHLGGGDGPWPELQPTWDMHAVGDVMSCGFLHPNPAGWRGAVNVYARRPHGLGDEASVVAMLLAAHAAVALASALGRDGAPSALGGHQALAHARAVLMATPGARAQDVSSRLLRGARHVTAVLGDRPSRPSAGAAAVIDAAGARRVADAVSRVLDAARLLPPDQLADLGLEVAAPSGATSVRIFLVEHSQRRLLPFAAEDATPLSVDGTIAGRAFLSDQIVERAHDDHVSVWIPLRDGVDRLGVVEFEVDALDDVGRLTLWRIAGMLAAEIVSKSHYSDLIALARRDQPFTLSAELHHQLLRPPSFATAEVTLAAALEPAYATAGDAFDYAYNGHVLHAAVFDAVGHDLHAGLVASLAVAAYRHGRRSGDDLSSCAAAIDRALRSEFPPGTFATGVLCSLDSASGAFSWINAGHPAPLLVRRGHSLGTIGAPHGPPLGMHDLLDDLLEGGQGITPGQLRLEPGDRILLYTDGIIESRSFEGQEFGLERLGEFVERAVAMGASDAELVRRLSHAIADHGDGEARDDSTLTLIHWHPLRGQDAAIAKRRVRTEG